jgi:hypothetical protein
MWVKCRRVGAQGRQTRQGARVGMGGLAEISGILGRWKGFRWDWGR